MSKEHPQPAKEVKLTRKDSQKLFSLAVACYFRARVVVTVSCRKRKRETNLGYTIDSVCHGTEDFATEAQENLKNQCFKKSRERKKAIEKVVMERLESFNEQFIQNNLSDPIIEKIQNCDSNKKNEISTEIFKLIESRKITYDEPKNCQVVLRYDQEIINIFNETLKN